MSASKRLLIVDDEPNIRLMLRTTLESNDYLVATAEDGDTALKWLEADSFDLVLLDLQMPRLDGMQVLEQLREAGNNVPVVIITAHGSVPNAVKAMKLGAIDFLAKPMAPEPLRKLVAEVLARHDEPDP
jgi:DNA-binding NtrC family response regulator